MISDSPGDFKFHHVPVVTEPVVQLVVRGLGGTLESYIHWVLGVSDDSSPEVRDEALDGEVQTARQDLFVGFGLPLVLNDNSVGFRFSSKRNNISVFYFLGSIVNHSKINISAIQCKLYLV